MVALLWESNGAELYCYHPRPQVADSGTTSRYRGDCETLGILYSGWVRTLGILCGGCGRGVCGVASRLVALTRDWLVGVNIIDEPVDIAR